MTDAQTQICLFEKGVWSADMTLSFEAGNGVGSKVIEAERNNETESIEVAALDSVVDEKVTYIKMDIEGAEMEALRGAKKLITKYKPRLAICIYHKMSDLTEIPCYIKSLVDDYKLYIRHYSNGTTDTVLYAV